MWELEVWASAMAWDWDADNINPDNDDSKLWIPMTAQTLNTETVDHYRAYPPMGPVMPPRQMTVYAVQLN